MKGSEIGYILYSDMTRSPNLVSGKTPIGVVVCSYADGGGQALALDSIGKYVWGDDRTDIPELVNKVNGDSASTNLTSYKNTAIIAAAGDKNKYPAAWAAHEYSTEETSPGDWCLPAAGVLTSTGYNISIINKAFDLVGGTKIERHYETHYEEIPFSDEKIIYENFWDDETWSSTEQGSFNAWYLGFGTPDYLYGSSGTNGKGIAREVRPVIGFCKDDEYKYDKNTDTCIPSCKGYYSEKPEGCKSYSTCLSGKEVYYKCAD